MTEQNENTIFEQLKQIRVEKDIDLEGIARESRIRLEYLKAIESGNIDALPNVYDKLFFSSYLDHLNISEEEKDTFIKQYRMLRRAVKPQMTTTIHQIKPQKLSPVRFNMIRRLYVIIPVILVLVIIAVLIFYSRGYRDDTLPVRELSVRDIVKDTTSNELKKEEPVEITTLNPKNVETVLSAKERTWLRLVSDQADTNEYMLDTGETITFEADSTLIFLIGNGYGVDFIINGEPKGTLCQPGEIISYLKVTAEGIVGQRNKTQANKEAQNDSTTNR